MAIAARQSEDGSWKLLEQQPDRRWHTFARDLDDDELSDSIAEMIEDGDLDASDLVLVVDEDDVQKRVTAGSLCTPAGLRQAGIVLGASAPVGGRRPPEGH